MMCCVPSCHHCWGGKHSWRGSSGKDVLQFLFQSVSTAVAVCLKDPIASLLSPCNNRHSWLTFTSKMRWCRMFAGVFCFLCIYVTTGGIFSPEITLSFSFNVLVINFVHGLCPWKREGLGCSDLGWFEPRAVGLPSSCTQGNIPSCTAPLPGHTVSFLEKQKHIF